MKNAEFLIKEKQRLEQILEDLKYGSIEIREKNQKRYIYLHKRIDGRVCSSFAGEYTKKLFAEIEKNNALAKEIKLQLKNVNKRLKGVFVGKELGEDVMLNIDFARRQMVSTIYKQAQLEGIATTYAETETIIEGGMVKNLAVNDVVKVLNLKHAWEFILSPNVILSPTNFALLCEINKLVEESFYYSAGRVRSTPVSIGGTNWKPPIPLESDIKQEIVDIVGRKKSVLDRAVDLLLYVMKKQIFLDGNKRTAVIFANHLLISNAKGLIAVPEDKVEKYKKLLINYYEGKDKKLIVEFLKKECYIKLK